MSNLRKLGGMLGGAIGRKVILRAARAQKVLRQWDEIVGPLLATRSRPERFDRGTVWVAVEGSAWAQELRMQRDTILARLNEISGEAGVFQDVRFGVRKLPERSEIVSGDPAEGHRRALGELTIKEIAERRLAQWGDEERT